MLKFLRTRFLLPLSEKFQPSGFSSVIEDGYILIKDKKIIQIGKYSNEKIMNIFHEFGEDNIEIIGKCKNKDDMEIIPQINGVAMPAFVKCHGHDDQSTFIGIAKDNSLTVWLDETVNVFGKFLHENEMELEELLGVNPYNLIFQKSKIDDLSFGITSGLTHACDLNKFHVKNLIESNISTGYSYNYIAVGSEDRNYPDFILDKDIHSVIDRLEEYKDYCETNKITDRVNVIPGPDQFFSNSAEFITVQKEWSRKYDTLFHTHSCEEPNTTKWFRETYGQTPVEFAYDNNVLDDKTILAHQVNCTENDLDIIQKTGAKVVHNPLANTILGSGMPPILDMIERGIEVSISTDSSGCSDNVNMINAGRLASQFQKGLLQDATVLPSEQILKMMTVIPSRCLELNKGSIEEDKDADIIVLDLNSLNLTPTHNENVLNNVVWAATGSEIQYVISNGHLVIDNYIFKEVDINSIKQGIDDLSTLFIQYKKNITITGTGANI